jgi:hypothetical protein
MKFFAGGDGSDARATDSRAAGGRHRTGGWRGSAGILSGVTGTETAWDNPVLRGQRACLFQNIIDNRFVGFDCHLEASDQWVLEEMEAPLP